MSMTYTLPVSSAEHFNHGHTHTHSHTRSHHRPRTNSRLAPPFPLPRIPSESLVQSEDGFEHPFEDVQAVEHDHNHTHHNSLHANGLIPTPVLEPNGRLPGKRKSPVMQASHSHSTAYAHKPRNVSKPTELLLHSTENYSLLHGILAEKDSRRIFYFMLLNLAFMVVQSTYGFLTGSLGLISDSIHMFFDCIALLVGICASVMSKWPASVKFPYGYGKIDTLAGLGNGIFLMLISIEIVYEAIERLVVGSDLSRTSELLVVSSIGLGVNLVGIMAFEHGHHGHSHGGHSHGHGHASHDDHQHHDHSDHKHNPSLPSASESPAKSKKSNTHHGHSHGGENMQGIYLHIMADALGSVAVVASTLLVKTTGWTGFDPLASCMIAILIFASAVPLVISTSQNLLLSLDSDIEYNLRDILAGVSEIKGIVGYAVPKFWLEDMGKKESDHDHDHDHSHDHAHDHSGHQHGHHHHDSADDHKSSCSSSEPLVLGVIHVIASQQADLVDVRNRVVRYLKSKNMDVIVQVEREKEGRCFCGGGLKAS